MYISRDFMQKSARNRMISQVVCISAAILMVLTAAHAQVSAGGSPLSFQQGLTDVIPTVSMAGVDVNAYLAEDALADKDEPYRFGASLDVHLTLDNSGKWTALPDGSRLWRLRLASPGAYSISVLYDRWFIPEGCDLFIYNDERDRVIGAFTSFNNWIDGTNITAPVAGDAVTLEYHESAEQFGQGVLSISNVVHAYRNLFGRPADHAIDAFGSSGSCNNNVNCPEGATWQTNKRGVTMILTSGGSRICTGSLINNTAQDQTPYFLTANHCLGGNNTWQFMFNYESPGCPNVDGPTNQTVSNSTLRANWSGSDFALLQLSSTPPAGYSPYYNGWNRVDAAATNSVCIHHPSGDIKKISFDNNAPTSDTWSGTPANSHWRILAWDDGTTEPGSSGSPLFDQNHRITGQLHGGTASCSNNIDDYFGKFALSWAGNGTNATRLSNWLDPSSSGVSTLDGLEGSSAASITVTAPNGGETWVEGSTVTVTWTSVNVTGNVNIDLNRSYSGGTWESIAANTANDGTQTWTVTLPASAALARVRITSVSAPTVSDVSNANFTIAARSITVSVPNGGETWIDGVSQNITWTSVGLTGNVNIELNRTYPSVTWESLAANTANDGTQVWTVTLPASTTARVRISSIAYPTVVDTSNANFTIAARVITVTVPNGGESWVEGTAQNITWTSANVTGTVNIDLNRSYSGGAWEPIVAGTTNDGTHPWTVSLPASSLARVRVTSVSFPAVSDVSNADFTIAARTITVTSPNGGETWVDGSSHNLTWTSSNVTGNVNIELNRSYAGGAWEPVAMNVANDGSEPWTVTSPVSTLCRMRVTSVSYPTATDESNANFTIQAGNTPPVIAHDRLDDQLPAPFTATAIVTDNAGGFVTRLIYWPASGGPSDSALFSSTGNPDEYATSMPTLAEGGFRYFIRSTDIAALQSLTDTLEFEVRSTCGSELGYDDGVAEASHYSTNVGYRWAVKFTPGATFALCFARVGISAVNPDSTHSPIEVSVYLADGLGGLPGTLLSSKLVGSVGNQIGGLPADPASYADVALRDVLGDPLGVASDFYIAVSNPESGKYEAFLHDTSGVAAGHSFVYDPCDSLWIDETAVHVSARRGNRMIRAVGYSLVPPVVVVSRSGNDIRLDWSATGAAQYHIYSDTIADGAFATFEGSSATNSFIDIGVLPIDARRFYRVVSSTTP
ncbi:trypsin-like peptidase domain-containing protein [candidate division KSB1 bacterium]|nr:trypsin-like peptidase domain-containing protein [candidate division KSB1 bacterium]